MSKRRFGFLDPVTDQDNPESSVAAAALVPSSVPQAPLKIAVSSPKEDATTWEPVVPISSAVERPSGPYLLRRFPRGEPTAPLGHKVRLEPKYLLEDYVRQLKRDGWPASESRVMEAMFELMADNPSWREELTRYLTGS
ncbi:hypothetical protein [Deinococcus alpinitundrae]|uniref:hypothetical protein n=1 Tax=Deinococcus alpinitundrae TaxID=468913 RepID=UPI00137AD1E9|nr:hypothetical protein [Deinococcus alpinitundrae]